jgi:glycosyltransferase involved in cell wall biosynthesis
VVQEIIQANPTWAIRYVMEVKQGVSHARNTAYREATGNYIVYIDDDELAHPDWLAQYDVAIQKYPDPVILAGRIQVKTMTPKPDWMTNYVECWLGKYDYGDTIREITPEALRVKQIAFPFAGNMAVKVGFLHEIGGFDPNLGRKKDQLLGGEETQVCMTALERGYQLLYVPHAIIQHIIIPERLSLRFLKEKHFMQGQSAARLGILPCKSRLRFLAGKIVYGLTLIPRLLSIHYTQRIETRLKLFFEMGILSGYIKRSMMEG